MIARNLNYKQAQWSLYLARFDFKLHHYSGKWKDKSDAMS